MEAEGISFMEASFQEIRIERKPWMEGKKLERVTSVEMLERVVDECIAVDAYAIDLETTGLDNRVFDGRTVDKIVGFCLSPNVNTGYYVPIRHKEGAHHNLSITGVCEQIKRLAKEGKLACLHNAGFDLEFMEYGEGEPLGDEWDDRDKFEDTQLMAYLEDSRRKQKGLKEVTLDVLGWEMIELTDLFPPDQPKHMLNFSHLDPSDDGPVLYACSDAICTLALYEHYKGKIYTSSIKGVPSQATIYKIEKMLVAAGRWMERSRIPLDLDKVAELIRIGQDDFVNSMTKLYESVSETLGRDVRPAWIKMLLKEYPSERDTVRIDKRYIDSLRGRAKSLPHEQRDPMDSDGKVALTTKDQGKAGYPLVYDVKSNRKLGLMLDELGIKMPKTDTGQISTAKEELDKVIEKNEQFEYMKAVKTFREAEKAITGFLMPMEQDSDKRDNSIRVSFKQHGTDTGRYSTPGKKNKGDGMHGGTSMNLHSLPSKDKKGKVESMRRIRECVRARPGKVLVAIDYSGVELRLVTALSREPKWIKAFFECSTCGKQYPRQADERGLPPKTPAYCYGCGDDRIGDLHTISGMAFYGEDAPDKDDWKEKRGYAKNTNFALLYGGTGNTVASRVGCDKNEGWRIYKQFNSTYPQLQKWQNSQVRFARKHGFVITALGRRYPTPDIDNEVKWIREKNERNAINGPIQGCLHGGSRISTSLGIRSVGSLWESQEAGEFSGFEVWTGRGWSQGRALFSGEKRLMLTTLDSGRVLRTSPEHLFRVWTPGQPNHAPTEWQDHFDWVPQQELTPDSWVATNVGAIDLPEPSYEWFGCGNSHNSKEFVIDGNSELMWEFLGMVYGDGSILQDGFILHVGESDSFNAEAFAKSYVDRLNSELDVGAIWYRKDRPQKESHKRPLWQVKIHNSAFRRFSREVLGIENENTYTKRIPDAVWCESLTNRRAFLRGYFSADGSVSATADAVSVRSVNLSLLEDAQALLNSVGIRASFRPKSLRVSVLDRARYRDEVGFVISHKTERLGIMKEGAYFGQWHLLPPSLIAWVGNVVYNSSIYGALPIAKKSAVLRLREGSGSKPQCLRYLNQVPDGEVPSALREALRYDYERVKSSMDTGETVTMYDIEVFDDDHAFVCDGAIVHNTSADVTKLAMALSYRLCKKNGWLDKVHLLITIHDELVFEIDEDIFEEAVEAIEQVMTTNNVIAGLKFPISLTTDVEFGRNWSVPYDRKDWIFQREALRDHEYKGKPVNGWPQWALDLFTNQSIDSNILKKKKGFEDDHEEPPPPSSSASTPAPTSSKPPTADARVPPLKMGEVYEYTLERSITPGCIESLSQAIHKSSRRGGSRRLRVVTSKGKVLLSENDGFEIDVHRFLTYAEDLLERA